jgi:hypothetical protein
LFYFEQEEGRERIYKGEYGSLEDLFMIYTLLMNDDFSCEEFVERDHMCEKICCSQEKQMGWAIC